MIKIAFIKQFQIISILLLSLLSANPLQANSNLEKEIDSKQTEKSDSILTPYHPDLSYSLEGKYAGVYVKETSSTFGTAPQIRIRGNFSFLGSSQPLWVVDGVKLENNSSTSENNLHMGNVVDVFTSLVSGINPEDIECIEILKDISATAIYGSNGANGVILVTTKKGKSGQLSINYTGKFTFNQKLKAADYNLLDSKSEMEIYDELYKKGWISLSSTRRASEYGVFGKMFTGISDGTIPFGADGSLNQDFLSSYAKSNTDWFDELFTNNTTQQHSVDISGGNDRTTFYTSFSHFNDDGFALGFNAKRSTINANIQQKIGEKLELGLKLTGSWRDQQIAGAHDAEFDAIEGKYVRSFESNPFVYAMNTSRAMRARDENGELEYFRRNYAPFNVIEETENNYLDISTKNLAVQFQLDYKITNNLILKSNYSYRKNKIRNDHVSTENSNKARAYRAEDNTTIRSLNPYLFQDPDHQNSAPYSILPEGGFKLANTMEMDKHYLQNKICWHKKLGVNNLLQMELGHELNKWETQATQKNLIGLVYGENEKIVHHPDLEKYLQMTNFNLGKSSKNDKKNTAVFGNASFNLDDKFVFAGTYRSDSYKSENTNKENLATWQLSSKWTILNKNYSNKFSFLSAKITYGKNESYPVSPYLNQNILSASILPEEMEELNLGIDFSLFASRINGHINFYERSSKDLLQLFRTSGVGGEEFKYQNAGEIKSDGVEINLHSKILQTKYFSWNNNWNIAFNKSEVQKSSSNSTISLATTVGANFKGKPLRALYSIEFAGLSNNGTPTFYGENNEVVDYLYLQSRENIEAVLKYEGPTEPKIFGGFSNHFKYKNLSLNIGLTYAFGHKIRVSSNYQPYYSDENSFPKDMLNRWKESGDELNTSIPKIISLREHHQNGSDIKQAYDSYNLSSESIAKGDFIRLNHIGLIYQLPKNIANAILLKRASLSVQANNVCLLYSDSKLNGMDPEYSAVGGVSLPVPKTYTVSIKIGL